MNGIGLYTAAKALRMGGLSESEIGVRLKVRRWTVSRMLKLAGLSFETLEIFRDCNISSSALREIASWPHRTQLAVIEDFIRLVNRAGNRTIRRRDVLDILIRKSRDLDRAPFPTSACRACEKRTGAQADFFGDVKPGSLGCCKDNACFARCWNAVAARRARWSSRIYAGTKNRKGKKK